MPATDDSGKGLVFSFPELFAEVNHKLDEIKELLGTKADKRDVESLRADHDKLGERVEKLELRSINEAAIASHRLRSWQLLTAIGGLGASGAIIAALFVH